MLTVCAHFSVLADRHSSYMFLMKDLDVDSGTCIAVSAFSICKVPLCKLHLIAAVGTLPEAPVLELEDLEACGLPVPVRHTSDSGQLQVYTALHSSDSGQPGVHSYAQ